MRVHPIWLQDQSTISRWFNSIPIEYSKHFNLIDVLASDVLEVFCFGSDDVSHYPDTYLWWSNSSTSSKSSKDNKERSRYYDPSKYWDWPPYLDICHASIMLVKKQRRAMIEYIFIYIVYDFIPIFNYILHWFEYLFNWFYYFIVGNKEFQVEKDLKIN